MRLIQRPNEFDNVLEEFKRSAEQAARDLGFIPEYTALILGNSPCIRSETIDNAVHVLEKNPHVDSVVTAERRPDFSPDHAFRLTDAGMLEAAEFTGPEKYCFFPNARLIMVRTELLLLLGPPFRGFSTVYGRTIYPILQEEGVADIDYPWQVPTVERWLRNNGFSDSATPYDVERKPQPILPVAKERTHDTTEKYRILITTVPFGEVNPRPLHLLREEPRCEFVVNPIGRKLKEQELVEMARDFDIIVAGTEPNSRRVMENAPRLKLISRVGIGLDSVDLRAAREKGIVVSYTPDAPAPAVAELTVGHMVNLNRRISHVDRNLREGVWQRIQGHRLANQTIGIIGVGRVGSRVLRHLQGFAPRMILVNDLNPDPHLYELCHAEHVSKEEIFKRADIITLHVPLTPLTNSLVTLRELGMMKADAVIINTSRGGVINEHDLFVALKEHIIAGAAVDVFREEPYSGELVTLDNCILSCHMGSCTRDCRYQMELQAIEEALRLVRGDQLLNVVPESEYQMAQAGI